MWVQGDLAVTHKRIQMPTGLESEIWQALHKVWPKRLGHTLFNKEFIIHIIIIILTKKKYHHNKRHVTESKMFHGHLIT